MTKIDQLLDRVRQLPTDRQEAIAAEVEFMLDHDGRESLLSEAQWAEVKRALANEDEPTIPHADVFERLKSEKAG